MSAEGNGRHAIPDWLRANSSWLIGGVLFLVAQWALIQDRTERNEQSIDAAEQRLNERFTALSVRLTQDEQGWQAERDKNLQQTNDLLAFQALLQADQETRDVRTKARDDQIDGVIDRVDQLEDNDRIADRWQATIDERMSNMLAQLARITALLEARLPDAQPAPAARPERAR